METRPAEFYLYIRICIPLVSFVLTRLQELPCTTGAAQHRKRSIHKGDDFLVSVRILFFYPQHHG